ncbi:hypothetical protein EZ456_07575 [Pedobacter psychrodurus]|uniref:Fucosyltransferase C-terminal domain-containing protein n=1 Tax=Pedobacter psychrodurus TaxID=2530456 RepID=A0A4V2MR43_9SPHI|nr:glycosyltransferase family 10 [Pedobacter psychrodurus]TCD27799.1 hypothetical protein EZ456_07575 [Pedobacter psychrodurus]
MKVQLTGFWEDNVSMFNLFKKYNFGNPKWKNIELTIGEDYDVLVIFTRPHDDFKDYDANKAITLLTEPPTSHRSHATSKIMDMYLPLPFWQNFSDKDWALLRKKEIEKTELLSSVTSELNYLEGHKARRQLVSILDKKIDDGLDLWGKQYEGTFLKQLKSYRGELTNKYDALWSYMYHFACENSFEKNYFTEKITDPIIAECLCFYDGCLNLEEFIDERAFVKINVFDPFDTIDNIINAIENNEWNRKIKYIRKQKNRLMNELNPINIIWLAVNGKDVMKACKL